MEDLKHNDAYCLDTLTWNHGGKSNGSREICHKCYGPTVTFDSDFFFLKKISKNSAFIKPLTVSAIAIFILLAIIRFQSFNLSILRFTSLTYNDYTLSILLTFILLFFYSLRLSYIRLGFSIILGYFAIKFLAKNISWFPENQNFPIISSLFLWLSVWQIISRNKRKGLFGLLLLLAFIFISKYPTYIFINLSPAPNIITTLLNSILLSSVTCLILTIKKDHNLNITIKTISYYALAGLLGIFTYRQYNDYSFINTVSSYFINLKISDFVLNETDFKFILLTWFLPQFIQFWWGFKIRELRINEKLNWGFSRNSILRLLQTNKTKAFDRVAPRVKYSLKDHNPNAFSAIFIGIAGKILYDWGKKDEAKALLELSKNAILTDSNYSKKRFRKDYAILNYFCSTANCFDLNERIQFSLESIAIFYHLGDRVWLMRAISQSIWLHYLRGDKQYSLNLIKEYERLTHSEGLEYICSERVKSIKMILNDKIPGDSYLGWRTALGNQKAQEVDIQDLDIMLELKNYLESKESVFSKSESGKRERYEEYVKNTPNTNIIKKGAQFILDQNSKSDEAQFDIMDALSEAIFRISNSIGIKENRNEFIDKYWHVIENTLLLGIKTRKYSDVFDLWQQFKSKDLTEDLSVSFSRNPATLLQILNSGNRAENYDNLLKYSYESKKEFVLLNFRKYIEDEWRFTAYFVKSLDIDVAQANEFTTWHLIFGGLKGLFINSKYYRQSSKLKKPIDFVRVVTNLNVNQLFIEYLIVRNRTFIMFVRKGFLSPKIEEISTNGHDLKAFINTTFKQPYSIISLQPETILTWSKFIEPAKKYLKEGDSILIVPSDYLYQMPLHALSLDQKPLIESYPISYLPSASVIRFLQYSKNRRSPKRKLIIGDPTNDLPFAKKEAEEISNLYQTKPILGVNASSNEILKQVKKSGIIHFACHAQFDEIDRDKSELKLSDGALSVEEIYSLNLNCELVVLSACQSGLNYISSADQIFGFTSAFLFAGAKNVLVSLWSVDDLVSSSIMVNYHLYLKKGFSPKNALQYACLKAKHDNPNFYFWAPFILIGI